MHTPQLMNGELPPQREVADWERLFLSSGNYRGPNLTEYGFPYLPGEYVPVDKRWSAMTEHKHALRLREYWQERIAV